MVVLVLAASFVLMVDDAIHDGDWPSWDEA
jgi:hypothetical protein